MPKMFHVFRGLKCCLLKTVHPNFPLLNILKNFDLGNTKIWTHGIFEIFLNTSILLLLLIESAYMVRLLYSLQQIDPVIRKLLLVDRLNIFENYYSSVIESVSLSFGDKEFLFYIIILDSHFLVIKILSNLFLQVFCELLESFNRLVFNKL